LFGQVKRVAAEQIYVLKAERPDSLDVLWPDLQAHPLDLRQRAFDVARIPEDDGVDHQTKRAELVFLTFVVALPQFSTLPVEDGSGETMDGLHRG
jgi:hypothetical protein